MWALRVLLLVTVFLAFVGCHHAARPTAPAVVANVPSFEAEKIEVVLDADTVLSSASGAAPVSLTASDGSGLRLTSLEARAVLYGPLAFTELHLSFANDEQRVREGTFAIQLPEGAA